MPFGIDRERQEAVDGRNIQRGRLQGIFERNKQARDFARLREMRVVEAGKEAVMGIWSQIKILGHKDTVKDIADGRGNLRAPVHVQIEPTEACNFRCTFCHWHNPELKEGFTSFDFTGKRSLDTDCMLKLVDELAELGVRAISFTGAGDPLMHGGLWKVLERIRARKIDYAVTSNFAMPLREELIEGLSHASWLRWSMNAGVLRPSRPSTIRALTRIKTS